MAAVEPENAPANILFTDIEGSTEVLARLGDRGWLELLRSHNSLVRQEVERCRGFEVKGTGDGFMVLFASTDVAIECAIAIQVALARHGAQHPDKALRVRIGVHVGRALPDEDDYHGQAVVIAARVMGLAHGGEILVSDAVRERALGRFEWKQPRIVRLKGLSGVHRIHPLAWKGAGEADLITHELHSVAPFTGRLLERGAVLEQLTAALERATGGSGEAVLVIGDAGIGKSSLLAAFRAEVRRSGLSTLTAQGSELERSYAFGVARQLFEPALDANATIDPAAAVALGGAAHGGEPATVAPYAVFGALTRLAGELGGDSPLVILVDDAHWSDDESLEWLSFLARRVAQLPVLLIAGARDEEADQPAPLRAMLTDSRLPRIALEPLSSEGVAGVVARRQPGASAAFVAACTRLSGGVPFYLHELLSAARAAGVAADDQGAELLPDVTPASVRRMVLRRLAPLGADASSLASACAVLESRADVRIAGTVAGLAAARAVAAADALVGAGLLRARRPLRFVHPIMRAVIEAELAPGARSELHRAAADALHRAGTSPEEVAAHLLVADPGGDPVVVGRLTDAAASALAAGSPRVAVRYLGRALSEPPRDGDVAPALTMLARAQLLGGDSRSARGSSRRALALERNPVGRAQAVAIHARALLQELMRPDADADWEHDGEAIAAMLEQAADSLPESERDLRFELALVGLSIQYARSTMLTVPMPATEVRRLEALVQQATGRSAHERELMAMLAGDHAMSGTAPVGEVLNVLRRCLEDGAVMRALGAGGLYAEAVEVLISSDAHAEAAQHLAQAARHAQHYGSPAAAALIASLRMHNAWLAGALDDALAAAEEVASELSEAGPNTYIEAMVSGTLAGVWLARGELDTAERHARAIEHPRLARHALGLVLAARGEHAAAVEQLRPAQETLDRRGLWRTGGPLRPVRPDLAVSLAHAGLHDEAARVAAAELEVARRFGSASCVAEALRAHAAVNRDRAALLGAAAVIRGCEARLVEARVQLKLGLVSDGAERRVALERAIEIAEPRGALSIARPARAALA